MDAPIVLPYARQQRRSVRRRMLLLAALCLTTGAAYWGYREISQRVAALQVNTIIGSVDWAAVLSSPTRLRVAWKLSSNPPLRDYSKILVPESGSVQVSLVTPFEFKEDKVHFTFVFTNQGKRSILVPSFTTCGDVAPHPVCGMDDAGVSAVLNGLLSRNTQIVDSGQSIYIEATFPARRSPGGTPLFFLYDVTHMFRFPEISEYAEWKDIPSAAIEHRILTY